MTPEQKKLQQTVIIANTYNTSKGELRNITDIVDLELTPRTEIIKRCLRACRPHDLSIQVVALPFVYSMMAFKSVIRIWMVMTGSSDDNRTF